jgi:dCTP deaminase
MFLSDRDLRLALDARLLIIDPPPTRIDTSSIDLHLDRIEQASVWDVGKFEEACRDDGHLPHLAIGSFNYRKFAPKYTKPIPEDQAQLVYRRSDEVIVRPQGFLLWQTRETVGTPEENARFICFVEGKSTRARTGFLVHMTAPTIHANWSGHVTLELCNLGPFTISLKEGDAVAQLTVAVVSSPPLEKKAGEIAIGQSKVTGAS